jgi:hypothetical protein
LAAAGEHALTKSLGREREEREREEGGRDRRVGI